MKTELDIMNMTLGECLEKPKTGSVIDRYVSDLSKSPVALFRRKKVSELVEIAVKQGMCAGGEAMSLLESIGKELKGLGGSRS